MGFLKDPNWNLSLYHPQARSSSENRLIGWNVPPEELAKIPHYWLSYPEPERSINLMLGILYIAFMVFSLIGNGLVIWIFSSSKSLRTPSNIFVVNLALMDFVMMLKTPIFIYNSFKNGFALGSKGCQIFGIMGSISGIGASMTNVCIAHDRYNVIAKPLDGRLSRTKALLMILFVYLYTIPWTVLPASETWGRFVPDVLTMLLTDSHPESLSYFDKEMENGHQRINYLTLSEMYNESTENISEFNYDKERYSSETKLLGWNTPASELRYIPEYWLTQQQPEPYMHFILALIYICFTFFAIIGNGLVIWIFLCAKDLHTPSNIFVVNLAILDFLMMSKTPIFIYNSLHEGFALGNFWCQFFATIGSYSGIGAGMTNAAIGYDRFNVITRPMDGRLTYAKAFVITGLIWAYATPWTLLPLFQIWGRFVPEGYLTSCTFDYMSEDFDTKLFTACIFTFSYVFPMTMIIYYYSQIVKHVFAHEKTLREQAKKMNVESLRSNADKNKESAEIRIAKAAITICFLFVASWTPYGVMAMIGAFGDKSLLTPGVTMIPACCCKMVACIDPYVYAISHPRYRLELQKKLPWLAINEKPPETASAVTENASNPAA